MIKRKGNKTPEEKIMLSLAGEYYVAAELSRQEYIASLTLKNYPRVDIFVLNPKTQQQITIQVKTIDIGPKQNSWSFNVTEAERYANFFIFVVIRRNKTDAPDYSIYILNEAEITQFGVKWQSKNPNSKKYQLEFKHKELEKFLSKWDKLFM